MSKNDRWIPWYFVAFFVVIAVVLVGMVTVAVRTQTGVVTEHPYEKGLAYNETVKQAEIQESLGWNGEISYNNNVISFTLHNKNGKIIIPDKITAKIFRPTQDKMDFSVELRNGSAVVDFPAKGSWEIRIFASLKDKIVGDQKYQQAKRIVVE